MEATEEEINVNLKVIKTIAVNIRQSETIRSLKSILHSKEGISENLQELFFAGERLLDDQKLADYGIQKNSTLQLFLQSTAAVKLFVNIPSRLKTIGFEVKTTCTIQNIKSSIQAEEGIQSDSYSLIYAGKLLEDNQPLASLKIPSESTLHLVFNPRDVMSISVEMPSGEIVKPEVKVLYTVRDVKDIIGSMVGVQISDHSLLYAGMELEDSKTLVFYDIKEESFLEMLPPKLNVFIKQLNSETVALDVCPQDTIKDVKMKIFHKLRVPVHVQNLVFAGGSLGDSCETANSKKEISLEDSKTLAFYKIKEDYILEMLPHKIQIFIKQWCGKTVTLNVCQQDTIEDVKEMIFRKLEVPVNVQNLVFAGKNLENDRDLASYNIEEHSTINVIFSSSALIHQMKLCEIGDPLTELPETTTIHALKALVQKKMETPVKEISLRGVVLQDHLSLADYAIREDTSLVVALQMRKTC